MNYWQEDYYETYIKIMKGNKKDKLKQLILIV